jgi:hypothetical protein
MTAFAAAALTGGWAMAQMERDQEMPRDRGQERQQQRDRVHQPDRMRDMQTTQTMMMMHHADDDVINASVTNLQQEDMGSIDALVVNFEQGHVAYAVVSFGGFLGIGDELHAVPWTAFATRPLYDGLVLDVTRDRLERQEGFTRNELPRWDDQAWSQRLHQEFGTQPHREQRRPMDPRMREGQPMNFEQQQPQRQQPQQPRRPMDRDEPRYPGMAQYVTTYDLIGMRVENAAGENVGTIRDFAFNLESGEVKYMVMGYGGWLGIAETYAAVPLGAFQPQAIDTDDPFMMLEVTRDQLRGAPEYRMDHWPRMGAADWADNLVREPRRDRMREPMRERDRPMR